MSPRILAPAILGLVLLWMTTSHAGENEHVLAQLSWSAQSSGYTNLAGSSGTNNLYLHLTEGVTNYRGGTMELT